MDPMMIAGIIAAILLFLALSALYLASKYPSYYRDYWETELKLEKERYGKKMKEDRKLGTYRHPSTDKMLSDGYFSTSHYNIYESLEIEATSEGLNIVVESEYHFMLDKIVVKDMITVCQKCLQMIEEKESKEGEENDR